MMEKRGMMRVLDIHELSAEESLDRATVSGRIVIGR